MAGRRKGTDNQRDALLGAVVRLLERGCEPETLTLRGIGEEAGVAHGLVNYHFGTKENLIAEAVGTMMEKGIDRIPASGTEDPRNAILALLSGNIDLGIRYEPIMRYAVRKDHEGGSWNVIRSLLPVLRRFFSGRLSELKIIVMAAQIAAPLQSFYLNPAPLEEYLGRRSDDPDFRKSLVEAIVDGAVASAFAEPA